MLKRPSVVAPLRPPSAPRATPMEVESTRVETLPDGKKLIDVTMRRMPTARDNEKLVMPQFDEDESSSSSSDDDEPGGGAPQHVESPMKKSVVAGRFHNDDEENDNNMMEVRESVAAPRFQASEFQWTGVQDIQTLTHTNAALHEQVADLKTQLKTLQIQLEALAPVPGLNASTVQDILLDKDGTEHDIRDTKIVHQAKTLRHLKRSLQREKQLASDAVRQCKALEAQSAALGKENETLKLKLARFQARASAAAAPVPARTDDGEEPQSAGETSAATAAGKDGKETLGAYKKKYEDMRIRHDKLLSDLKKTQRALLREVGEDASLEEIVEGNGGNGAENARRGRAQQIIMLKAKVKKLEQELAKGTSTEAQTSGTGSGSIANTGNVDQRAMQDLALQHAQKQRVIDKLTSERDELLERHQQLTNKFDALKSRTQILEKEKQDHKAKLQVLMDKSRNDDALVDALQRQLETWKGKLQEAKRARTAESSSVGSGGGSTLPKEERLELDRLRVLVADYKRQQSSNCNNSGGISGLMPPMSEAGQYRSITAEKERLAEQVKVLQSQLEDKERQIRAFKSSGDQNPPPVSRIPRLGSGLLPTSQYFPTPPPPTHVGDASALEAQKKSFRDAMIGKEQEIEALKAQLQRLTQQQQQPQPHEQSAQQEIIQDLQEENEYLRQEFDRLKTRYEAVLKSTRKPTN